MNQFVRGEKDITILWHILKVDGSPLDLGEYEYDMMVFTGRGCIGRMTTSVSGLNNNVVSWLFKKEEQAFNGMYSLRIVLRKDGVRFCQIDYHNAFVVCEERTDELPGTDTVISEGTEISLYSNAMSAVSRAEIEPLIQEMYKLKSDILVLIEQLGVKRHMVITQSLDGILGYNDTEVVTARVEDGLGNDVTDEYYGWSCTRDSGDEVSDYVWNREHVNCGNEILISRNDVRISDGRTYNTFTFMAYSEYGSLEGVLKLNQ